MEHRLRHAIAVCMHPRHLRRTGLIALIVGTWLSAVNQGPLLMAGQLNAGMVVQIALNLLTPFVVSNLGLLSRSHQ